METLGTVLVHESNSAIQGKIRAVLSHEKLVFTSDKDAEVMTVMVDDPVALVVGSLDCKDVTGVELLAQWQSQYDDLPVFVITADPPYLGKEFSTRKALHPQDVGTLRERLAAALEEHSALKAFRHEYMVAREALTKPSTHEFTDAEEEALKSVGFPVDAPLNPKPIARRAAHFTRLRATSLTTEAAAKKLSVNPSRVRQRLTAKPPQLYGIRQGNEWRLPTFQFGASGLVPNIEKVIPKLPHDLDPVAVDVWFTAPHVDLVHGGKRLSPLAWLSQGLPFEPVAELAEHL